MRATTLILVSLAALLAACGEEPGKLGIAGKDDGGNLPDNDGDGTPDGTDPDGETVDPALAARQVDYNEALRTASLKLVRRLPTLDQIRTVDQSRLIRRLGTLERATAAKVLSVLREIFA